MKKRALFLLPFSLLLLASCSKPEPKTQTFHLVAKEVNQTIGGKPQTVWTYNGKVPGEELRVKVGQTVKIVLKNELPVATTIHWHGIAVPNDMDGVPELSQTPVQPGKTFTYTFTAKDPGTYIYHSHVNSAYQVDKGLYGSIIVEGEDQKNYDRDYTVILDEWLESTDTLDAMFATTSTNTSDHTADHNQTINMSATAEGGGHNHSHGGSGHDMSAWSIFTMNGKTNDELKPLAAEDGDVVKLRLINIGHSDHYIKVNGTSFKVTHVDGQRVNEPETVENKYLLMSPGERYDIEFVYEAKRGINLERMADATIPSSTKWYVGKKEKTVASTAPLGAIDFANYGVAEATKQAKKSYDVSYKMELGQSSDGSTYTINGKTFAELDPFMVKRGDFVHVTITNPTNEIHPMHLHGHTFTVIKLNGEKVKGSTMLRDTILVQPNETYDIVFTANNPGEWMFHCHKLHHSAAGMASTVKYESEK